VTRAVASVLIRSVYVLLLFAGSTIQYLKGQTTLSACAQPGSEVGTQLNAAIKTLVAGGTGGIVDATCYAGEQHINSNMLAGVGTSLPITVKLAPATFVLASSGAQQVLTASNFTLEGSGTYGTTIEFNDPQNDIFVIPNTGASSVGIRNLIIRQAATSNKTAGNVFNVQGQQAVIRDIQLFDPYNGFFVYNAFSNQFQNIWISTTRSGTLNYGFYLYGTDIDNFFTDIYGTSSYPTEDAFLHIRNRVSGGRFSNISFQSNNNSSPGSGILFDCGSSPTTGEACTNAYSGNPLNRPELLHFDKVFIEAGTSGNAVTVNGGQDLRFTNSYFATSLTGFSISGESTAIDIGDSIIVNMQHQCIYDNAGSMIWRFASLNVHDDEIGICSQAANQRYPAIELAPNINHVGIIGNHIGHNTFTNFAWDSPIAVKVSDPHTYVRILDNDLTSFNANGISFYSGFSGPITGSPGTGDSWLNNIGFSQITSTGFTGTKIAGPCTFAIENGIITNVTGC
jgi:hypothetical protein